MVVSEAAPTASTIGIGATLAVVLMDVLCPTLTRLRVVVPGITERAAVRVRDVHPGITARVVTDTYVQRERTARVVQPAVLVARQGIAVPVVFGTRVLTVHISLTQAVTSATTVRIQTILSV